MPPKLRHRLKSKIWLFDILFIKNICFLRKTSLHPIISRLAFLDVGYIAIKDLGKVAESRWRMLEEIAARSPPVFI